MLLYVIAAGMFVFYSNSNAHFLTAHHGAQTAVLRQSKEQHKEIEERVSESLDPLLVLKLR